MQKSENLSELAAALAKAQGMYKPLTKNRTAKVKMKAGGEYSYKYADLYDVVKSVQEALSTNSLALCQGCSKDEKGEDVLESFLFHSSGQFIANSTPILAGQYSDGGPQAFASSLTYARRYGACALLGVVGDEDDDSQIAQDSYKKKPPVKPPPTNIPGSGTQPAKPSEAQIKRLFAICHSSNWTDEQLREHLKKTCNIDSTKDLTWLQYDNVCKVIQAMPKVKQ